MGRKILHENYISAWSQDSIRLIATPGRIARTALYYIQEIGYFKTNHPYFTERKNLKSFLIIYTISGKGMLEYQNSLHTLTKGSCFLINCSQLHKYYTPRDSEWEFIWVHFYGPNIDTCYQILAKSAESGLPLLPEADPSIADMIRSMISLTQARDSAAEIRISQILYTLLTQFFLCTAVTASVKTQIPPYIEDIVQEINSHYAENIGLDFFSVKYNRSKYHLTREFKTHIGVPLHEYLIATRISHAKEMLRYTNTPVSQIAYEVGFHHISHFINLFKAREGDTPSSYRNIWKQHL